MAIFAKNVRFLYYKEANKKRHLPLKVAPMCAKAHIIRNSVEMGAEAELFVYDRNILELSHETVFIYFFRNLKLLKMERKLENLILVFEEFKIGYIRFGQLLLSIIFWFDNLDNSGISLHLIGDGRTFDVYFHTYFELPEPSSDKMLFFSKFVL